MAAILVDGCASLSIPLNAPFHIRNIAQGRLFWSVFELSTCFYPLTRSTYLLFLKRVGYYVSILPSSAFIFFSLLFSSQNKKKQNANNGMNTIAIPLDRVLGSGSSLCPVYSFLNCHRNKSPLKGIVSHRLTDWSHWKFKKESARQRNKFENTLLIVVFLLSFFLSSTLSTMISFPSIPSPLLSPPFYPSLFLSHQLPVLQLTINVRPHTTMLSIRRALLVINSRNYSSTDRSAAPSWTILLHSCWRTLLRVVGICESCYCEHRFISVQNVDNDCSIYDEPLATQAPSSKKTATVCSAQDQAGTLDTFNVFSNVQS